MKLSIVILAGWMLDCILAGRSGVQGSSLVVRNRLLHRRAPAKQSPPSSSLGGDHPRTLLSKGPSYSRAIMSATVQTQGEGGPFTGTAYTKNEHGKTTATGEDARYVGQFSRTKVSAGATQQGKGSMRATAMGKNLGVKLVVPEGSQGSYIGEGNVKHNVDHTMSPFKKKFSGPPIGFHASTTASITGPGSVKAKAWN